MGLNGVIQGSFRCGRVPVLQARAAASVQAKTPLPFAATGGKPAAAGPKVVAPPVRFPNQKPAPAQAKPTAAKPLKPPLPVPPPRSAVQPKPASTPAVVQLRGGGEAFAVPATLNLSGGGGQPLPAPVREKMESFFGTSFADVRVHVGNQASSIGALAFTHGSNLYFAPGQYNPGTAHGQQLLGHELTHVVQQRAGRVKNPFGSGVAVVQDHSLEAEADRMGLRVVTAPTPIQTKPAGSGTAAPRGTPSLPTSTAAVHRAILPMKVLKKPNKKVTDKKDVTTIEELSSLFGLDAAAINKQMTRMAADAAEHLGTLLSELKAHGIEVTPEYVKRLIDHECSMEHEFTCRHFQGGSVLAPLLENLLLRGVERELAGLARSAKSSVSTITSESTSLPIFRLIYDNQLMKAYANYLRNSGRVIGGETSPTEAVDALEVHACATEPGGFDFELYLLAKYLYKYPDCIVQCGTYKLGTIMKLLFSAQSNGGRVNYAEYKGGLYSDYEDHVFLATRSDKVSGDTKVGGDVTVWFPSDGPEGTIVWTAKVIQVKSVTRVTWHDNLNKAHQQIRGYSNTKQLKDDEQPLGGAHQGVIALRTFMPLQEVWEEGIEARAKNLVGPDCDQIKVYCLGKHRVFDPEFKSSKDTNKLAVRSTNPTKIAKGFGPKSARWAGPIGGLPGPTSPLGAPQQVVAPPVTSAPTPLATTTVTSVPPKPAWKSAPGAKEDQFLNFEFKLEPKKRKGKKRGNKPPNG